MEFKIYTNYEKIKNDSLIKDNDSFFYENVKAVEFTDIDINVMRNIDKAELLDANTGKIQTPRGICSIEDLSTGCKTVLNYLFICRNNLKDIHVIDITGCGANAIEELLKTIEITGIAIDLVLMHKDKLFECGERNYIIDDYKHINNLLYM